ncbi:TrmB family transcriptional regulator [archaeon SCG-AAA382B04]|nr:TrmB family transcriptional regulator [archaeon SCG-AAA382B04]
MNLSEIIEEFEELGFKEYESKVLVSLIQLGEAKASKIAETSGVPKNRVYEVLKVLRNHGLVKEKPGRPKLYETKKPKQILKRLRQNKKLEKQKQIQKIQEKQKNLTKKLTSIYNEASGNRKSLLELIDVGEPSEKQTQLLYKQANEEILISTKSFEYYPRTKKTLKKAIKEKDLDVRILFLDKKNLSKENRKIQEKIIKKIKNELPSVDFRFSEEKLPLRGTIIDPSLEYESGKTIFLVEEKEVPLALREAALTENPSLVAGMARYFNLIWNYESKK